MKYADLISFDPIESVVQLREANKLDDARRLVETYVVSEEMAERIADVLIPQLQYDVPNDNMGVFVVGNYGTGKSHLMSVISSIAEYADLTELLSNKMFAERAVAIAGRFKVIRVEIGAVMMNLRDIIARELETGLAELGVDFAFPEIDQITENKATFGDMMASFHREYPDHGLLLVVDELLDYLRSRRDHELVLDLSFLREVGEGVRDLRFRFIAGIQEAIFDSPNFRFAADALRRVKARFQEISIARRDVKFVVSERLLRKTLDQKAAIREHLAKFSKFYENMNERMDEYVELFPVHPNYIDTFDRVDVIEKREILRSLSDMMKSMLSKNVPDDEPGLIAYDQYWSVLRGNAAFRALPEVRDVLNCSHTLEERVQQAYTRPQYRDLAIRLIHGLAVHRLTVRDTDAPIGATTKELRDNLTLFHPGVEDLGGDPAEDLLTLVETALQAIVKTVNGQFISYNRDNGQYYLDLAKTEDFDALIANRASTLSDTSLDRYYFDALKQVLELIEVSTVATGFNIWQYEIEWRARRSGRLGYLFFGSPNERSTAVPERDFYLYFIQPFDPPQFKDEHKSDEVFFRIVKRDDVFDAAIRNYAAATDLSLTSAGHAKKVYISKANEYLRDLVNWLNKNLVTAFEVTHKGKTLGLLEWIKGKTAPSSETYSLRDYVNAAGDACLTGHFEQQAPEYPEFTVLLNSRNRDTAVQDALRWMSGTLKTKQGASVLDALELLDGDSLTPYQSRYANAIRDLMKKKGAGQVANRSEIVASVKSVLYFMPDKYRLEPELVIVVLAALVYSGDVVLALAGKKHDASTFNELANTPVRELVEFKHIEKPKDWEVSSLNALFELLRLPTGLVKLLTNNDSTPVQELQKSANSLVTELVTTQQKIQGGLPFWGRPLLDDARITSLRNRMERSKQFLETLQPFVTPAKLKNFSVDAKEVASYGDGIDAKREIEAFVAIVEELGPIASYLTLAEAVMPEDHAWVSKVRDAKQRTAHAIDLGGDLGVDSRRKILNDLKALKTEYITAYSGLHSRARLGHSDDQRKSHLTKDSRLRQIMDLATIDLMPTNQLTDLQNRLANIRSCFALTNKDLEVSPTCPHCNFQPTMEPNSASASLLLDKVDSDLDQIVADWTATLLANLQDPTVQDDLDLLSAEDGARIDAFMNSGELPADLDKPFLKALQEVLSGLIKVTIRFSELRHALTGGGSPVTPVDLQKRFEQLIADKTQGKDRAKVRIVLEQENE